MITTWPSLDEGSAELALSDQSPLVHEGYLQIRKSDGPQGAENDDGWCRYYFELTRDSCIRYYERSFPRERNNLRGTFHLSTVQSVILSGEADFALHRVDGRAIDFSAPPQLQARGAEAVRRWVDLISTAISKPVPDRLSETLNPSEAASVAVMIALRAAAAANTAQSDALIHATWTLYRTLAQVGELGGNPQPFIQEQGTMRGSFDTMAKAITEGRLVLEGKVIVPALSMSDYYAESHYHGVLNFTPSQLLRGLCLHTTESIGSALVVNIEAAGIHRGSAAGRRRRSSGTGRMSGAGRTLARRRSSGGTERPSRRRSSGAYDTGASVPERFVTLDGCRIVSAGERRVQMPASPDEGAVAGGGGSGTEERIGFAFLVEHPSRDPIELIVCAEDADKPSGGGAGGAGDREAALVARAKWMAALGIAIEGTRLRMQALADMAEGKVRWCMHRVHSLVTSVHTHAYSRSAYSDIGTRNYAHHQHSHTLLLHAQEEDHENKEREKEERALLILKVTSIIDEEAKEKAKAKAEAPKAKPLTRHTRGRHSLRTEDSIENLPYIPEPKKKAAAEEKDLEESDDDGEGEKEADKKAALANAGGHVSGQADTVAAKIKGKEEGKEAGRSEDSKMASVLTGDFFKRHEAFELQGSMKVNGSLYKNTAPIKIDGDLWVRGEVYKNSDLRVAGTIYCTNFYSNEAGSGTVAHSGDRYHNSEDFEMVKTEPWFVQEEDNMGLTAVIYRKVKRMSVGGKHRTQKEEKHSGEHDVVYGAHKHQLATLLQAEYRGQSARKLAVDRHKAQYYRHKVLGELVATERSYHKQLTLLVELVLLQLEWNSEFSPRPIMAHQDIEVIFTNIREVQQTSGEVLAEMEKKFGDAPNCTLFSVSSMVGDFLRELLCIQKLGAYIQYCRGYQPAVARLAAVLKEQAEAMQKAVKAGKKGGNRASAAIAAQMPCHGFYEFWQNLQSHEDIHGSRCESFLILPVQRIMRYGLLLQELRKRTWKEHPDYDAITTALETATLAASLINSSAPDPNRDLPNRRLSMVGKARRNTLRKSVSMTSGGSTHQGKPNLLNKNRPGVRTRYTQKYPHKYPPAHTNMNSHPPTHSHKPANHARTLDALPCTYSLSLSRCSAPSTLSNSPTS
jgi:hypothetical protein